MQDIRSAYQAPSFEKVGTFEAITQAGVNGTKFDGNFAAGQPVPFTGGKPAIFS
ncbi:lasso RiPP family leader peptide-containing protein [Caulobacter sp. S45]|uniref:lasso RiPP family leader peptide-containing protein n=1 Tax=Caulobacter sp. S45 TaxID=1641861 RepID=UPI00131E85E0|nr:lasso RiPP family leader peptide-containing protein [Caulobacter sp. S45]